MAESSQSFVLPATRAPSLLHDYAPLTKARITILIVVTTWSGYFFGAHRAAVPALSAAWLHALLGVGLVSSGTAALNEVLESVQSASRRLLRATILYLPLLHKFRSLWHWRES